MEDKSQMAGKNQQRGFQHSFKFSPSKIFLKFPQMCDAVQHDHSATGLNESSLPMGTLLIDIFLNTDIF